jgi:hypothetical protein
VDQLLLIMLTFTFLTFVGKISARGARLEIHTKVNSSLLIPFSSYKENKSVVNMTLGA